jgi:hypothetical protein
MTTSRPSLPEYAHPPLVAATLGVHCGNGPEEISASTLAEFQERLGPEWAGRWKDVTMEIESVEKDFGFDHWAEQLTNVLGDRVIRVSNSIFSFTWLGTADARYPRYENVRDGFVAAWDIWSSLPQLDGNSPYGWAVCYLNRIPQGTVWQTPADWKFFQLHPSHDSLSSGIATAEWQLQTAGLDEPLYISWFLESSSGGELPAIWLKLLATGSTCDHANLLDGMDAGRAAIVKTFSDLMSPAANAYWGLRRREI